MCRKSAGITENVQKLCRYYRKGAENLQVLQKMCIKSAGITKCAENLQVSQKICCVEENLQGVAENLHSVAENLQGVAK